MLPLVDLFLMTMQHSFYRYIYEVILITSLASLLYLMWKIFIDQAYRSILSAVKNSWLLKSNSYNRIKSVEGTIFELHAIHIWFPL